MRFAEWLGLSLTASFLLLSGCGGGDSNQPPAALRYTTGTAVYTVGVPITVNIPTSSSGAVTSYSVSPDLPAGLNLSTSTGIISGTPTSVTAAASYTVTASNAAGSTTATLTITVNAGAVGAQFIPNMNQWITPLAPQGSQFAYLDTGLIVNDKDWLAGQAVSTVVSPDGNTLLVLTSGFNRVFNAEGVQDPDDSQEYVFIYDISQGVPVFKQVVMIPNSYHGIAFDPKQDAFYVSSGMGDYPYDNDGGLDQPLHPGGDNVHIFTLGADGTTWAEQKPELPLNHAAGVGLGVSPCAAGVAVSQDGQTLVVANYYNDSITVFTGGLGHWAPLGSLTAEQPGGLENTGELDLRPGKASSSQAGTPGGEYPFWVVVATTTNTTTSVTTNWAYVSSIRDREIDVVDLSQATPAVTDRIKVKGQPNKMTLNALQTRLYVAEDQSDTVDVIDINPNDGPTLTNTVVETIQVTKSVVPASLASYTGANTNSVTLSPDETELYVTNGNLNSVAVVSLTGTDKNDKVVGLIPTGWYPNSVSFSPDGTWVYVVNGKSPTGANPNWCYGINGPPNYPNCLPSNEYNPQRIKAGLQSFPTAPLAAQLPALTAQVLTNNRFSTTESKSDAAVMAAVRQGVKHVIFIIKENRTYDQILGDLENGSNGDRSLVEFGQKITPNLHNLAQSFVTLDNLLATSEVSYDGWSWTTGARATDVVEHQYTVNYANRGLSLDFNGFDRNVNVAIPTLAGRRAANPVTPDDPDVLAGDTDVAAPDGPNNEVNTGHLWDAALRAGITLRNYGFFVDPACYGIAACAIPLARDPAATGTVVAFPANVALTQYTDPYYRGFDPNFPDYYRYREWEREFDANYANGGLPGLSLVELGHDHTGNFATAIDLVNTPELQEADNDYAVGLLVQKIAGSIYANDTLIFVIEDDAQDGGDHVDSHRTTAYVAGAYVKQGAVVPTAYTTLDFIRTMEEVLGIPPMNLNDALASPMADIFYTTPHRWSFGAAPSAYLYATNLPLPPAAAGLIVPKSTHSAEYWAGVTKGLDFTDPDRVDSAVYNRILWKGLMGNKPYPAAPTGMDLRKNRKPLLARYRPSLK
jgi:DNA-binding beta-propeller fold protein YncE